MAGKGKRGPPPGEGAGRPRMAIDLAVVTRAASIGCTIAEIAALTAISPRTFTNRMEKDEAFAAAVEQARGQGRATLRRLQWHRANNGSDTMLIWLGKNMLGQSDRHELGGPGGGPIEMVVTGVRRAMDIEGDATEVPLDPEPDVATGVQRTIEDDAAD
jgi:hypothetical protein